MTPGSLPQANENGTAAVSENERPKLATEFSGAELVAEFLETLETRSPATRDVYGRTLYRLTDWIARRPGSQNAFTPEALTRTAISQYLGELDREGRSLSSQTRVKAVTGRFARWLLEEKGLLRRNPVREVTLPPQQALAPRELTPDQRYTLQNLVEREGTARCAALFALGYWTGCRVSDVAHLTVAHTHVGPKVGWLRVGYKGEQRNNLARAIYFYRRGTVQERSSEEMTGRASGLNLVVAAIILWNTVYLQKAIQRLEEKSAPIPASCLPHLSPLLWDHILLTGEYHWKV